VRLDVQRRTMPTGFEMRGDAGSGATLIGHAAVFDVEAIIMRMFREKISAGSFKKTIKEADVRALFNHEPNFVLGRNKAKPTPTLRMNEDKVGLAYEIDLPETQIARDLYTSIERGDISQSSFAFTIVKELRTEPDEDKGEVLPLFDIQEVKLYDVSPVTYPAYDETDVAVNSADDPIGYAVAIARFAEWCQKPATEVHKYLEQISGDSERALKIRQLWVKEEVPVERSEPAEEPPEPEGEISVTIDLTGTNLNSDDVTALIAAEVAHRLKPVEEAAEDTQVATEDRAAPEAATPPDEHAETPAVSESDADRSAEDEATDAADTPEPPVAEERADTLDEPDDSTDEPTAEDAEPLVSRARVRKTLSTF